MSELDKLTYAALITISLPGNGESITVPVVLKSLDSLPLEGSNKLLADCTLSELLSYATELERGVWEAYEAITLPHLKDNNDIDVEVVLSSDPSQAVNEWTQQVLLRPGQDEEEQEQDKADQSEQSSAVVDEPRERVFVADELTVADEIEAESELEAGEPAETVDDDVAVAETELVYPEIEDEHFPEVQEPEAPAAAVGEIIPSRARVRVAGMQLPSGHPTWAAVDILMDEPALRAAQAHALSSLNREVAGVLIGPRPEKQPDGRYLVHIIDTIVAKHTVMQGASVTYTPESWRYLNDTLQQRYPDDTGVMVGWYHTHPGFGVFLSGMDLFIHQNFFTQIWHIAMVLDPRARTSGFFCWDRPKSKVSRCDFAWPAWAAGSW
jgi:proteasome lid subunit RPN8/RPN11